MARPGIDTSKASKVNALEYKEDYKTVDSVDHD